MNRLPLQAHGRCGAGRENVEQWAHDIPAEMSRYLCGTSWLSRDGQWPVDAGEACPIRTC